MKFIYQYKDWPDFKWNNDKIEGEFLNPEQVRSSIARRLGLNLSGLIDSDRNVDGLVEMMLDAADNFNKPLTKEGLFGWHNLLFPAGYGGLYKIIVAKWRDDSKGSMQVVSGPMGIERVHFQAPKADLIDKEILYKLPGGGRSTGYDLNRQNLRI
jgi:Fic family protein